MLKLIILFNKDLSENCFFSDLFIGASWIEEKKNSSSTVIFTEMLKLQYVHIQDKFPCTFAFKDMLSDESPCNGRIQPCNGCICIYIHRM